MRLASIVTALVVAVALYALVYERDRLLEFAGTEAQPANETAEQTESEAAETQKAVSVVVLDSAAETVENAVVLRGETEAARQVDVMAQVSGLVISEPLRKGRFVAADELLCRIDPATRQAQLTEAEARLTEAQILDRAAVRLAEGGFGSETRSAEARAALQAAQAAVDIARTEIDRLDIRAPFAGLLETDTAELGALLQPGLSCATVIALNPIKLVGYLPETAVSLVQVGAPARARITGGREIEGTVSFLSRSSDPDTRTFRVEVNVPNEDLAIRDGLSAEIAIAADGVDAHWIPQSALTLDDSGTMGVEIVAAGDVARFVPVQIVRDAPDGVFVTGPPAEAQIIVVGQEYVSDGVPVIPTVREMPS